MTTPHSPTACPPGSVLAAIAHGDSDDAEAIRHAEDCPACRAVIHRIRSNQEFLQDFLDGGAADRLVTPSEVSDPARIADYQITGAIGRGGQGVVYKAVQAGTGRNVALKLPLHGDRMSERERLRFDTEIKIAAGMRHPYIVTVYESGRADDGRYYVAMEYIRGLRLDEWARRAEERSPDPGAALRAKVALLAKVCDAVQYAHQRMIMHRDLKPGNILVDGDDNPRLLDFGIARAVAGDDLLRTMTGQFAGTPAYASPEQVAGHPDQIDLRTDIYSLGVVLFELAFGLLPYPADAPLPKLLQHIAESEPRLPDRDASGRAAAVDVDLRTVILKSLSKDRDRRYQTAHDLGDDLRQWLAGDAVSARRDSTWYVIRKLARRRRGPLVAAGLLLLTLVLGAAFTTVFAIREAAARERAERRGRETEQVASFQAAMLNTISPARLGQGLLRSIRTEARKSLDDRGGSAADLEALDAWLGAMNTTNIALDVLDENVIAGAERAAREDFADQPLVQARLLLAISGIRLNLGLPDRALPAAESALELRRTLPDDDDAETIEAMNGVGIILQALGRFDESESQLREAVERSRRTLGPDHPATLDSLHNLAVVLHRAGRFDEAETPYHEAIEGYRRSLGPDDPHTLSVMSSMVEFLHDRGRLTEAEKTCRDVLDARRRVLGPDSAETLTSLSQLASVIHSLGRPEEAEPFYREVLERTRRLRGDDHPDTLAAINDLAEVLCDLGKLDDAEALHRETVASSQRVLGPSHPDTMSSINNLGGVLEDQNRLAEAEECYRKAADGFRRSLGPGHRDTLRAVNNLGGILLQTGRAEEAAVLFRQTLDGFERALGPGHWETAQQHYRLGRSLLALGQFEEAETHLLAAERVLATAEGAPEEGHARCVETLVELYEDWAREEPGRDVSDNLEKWRSRQPR